MNTVLYQFFVVGSFKVPALELLMNFVAGTAIAIVAFVPTILLGGLLSIFLSRGKESGLHAKMVAYSVYNVACLFIVILMRR